MAVLPSEKKLELVSIDHGKISLENPHQSLINEISTFQATRDIETIDPLGDTNITDIKRKEGFELEKVDISRGDRKSNKDNIR